MVQRNSMLNRATRTGSNRAMRNCWSHISARRSSPRPWWSGASQPPAFRGLPVRECRAVNPPSCSPCLARLLAYLSTGLSAASPAPGSGPCRSPGVRAPCPGSSRALARGRAWRDPASERWSAGRPGRWHLTGVHLAQRHAGEGHRHDAWFCGDDTEDTVAGFQAVLARESRWGGCHPV